MLSEKQLEYLASCGHRWNVKTGATGSGKSWLDYAVVIPKRLQAMRGEGAAVIFGNTQGTASRNILERMRGIWGGALVGTISYDNSARIFGRKVYVMGADNRRHVALIQGMDIEYAYGDEITTWHEDVFQMLKSRLRCPHSVFDGTCNPANPEHWLKAFLDSDADIYSQASTIDDNPFLPRDVVENLKREYAGTVYYDRYILGRWVAAEGAVYRQFADEPARFLAEEPRDERGGSRIAHAFIGVDFGGNGSAHAFCALGTDRLFRELWILDEYYRKEIISPQQLEADFCAFVRSVADRWKLADIRADSAEQVLIRGLNLALLKDGLRYEARNARKGEINGRIRFTNRMLGAGRFHVLPHCRHTIDALRGARWDPKHRTEDVRLDDGTLNIDSLDAMEYAFEPIMGDML